ncbi:WD40-repeat-containing domain protein [Lentinula raphanica]|nr:WD40-repeat-containing domain protein [Lentinula raphanica]
MDDDDNLIHLNADQAEALQQLVSINRGSQTLLTISNKITDLIASAQSRDNRSFAAALVNLLSADSEQEEDDQDQDYHDEEEEEDDEESFRVLHNSNFAFKPHTTPQAAGVDLIKSGEFGRVVPKIKARKNDRNLANIFNRRLDRPHPAIYKEDYVSNIVPNSNGVIVANYDANIYTAQYSKDSSFFYTCSQDFRLHIYDTTKPPDMSRENAHDGGPSTTMKLSRSIQGRHGRWTITDANLSPDNDRIIYSSITSTAYICSTKDDSPAQIPIPFHDSGGQYRGGDFWDSGGSFGIFSCRFSADGNEVIAGGRGHIYVYDLLANKRSVKILAHQSDVNSCCWADTSSGNVLVSASDDTFLKVWDRRSLGSSPKPSGVLVGHTEGITYVSAKGDGRYVLSNGKDQAMRLWDLRKMRSNSEYERTAHIDYGLPHFDYRTAWYPRPRYRAHPLDCSVMTYRGHAVLTTLIRCHFSPIETTGGQYLYSGSADGKVHIWSLDGTLVQVLDRSKTLPMHIDPSGPEYNPQPARRGRDHSSCVRDVSWSSEQPVMISAAWDSSYYGSTLARHEWKGLSKMSNSLKDWEEKRRQEEAEELGSSSSRRSSSRIQQQRSFRRLFMPGMYDADDSM